MMTRWWQIIRRLSPALLPETEQGQDARTLSYILLWSSVGFLAALFALLITTIVSRNLDVGRFFIIVASGLWIMGLYWFLRKGYLKATSISFVLMTWCAATFGVMLGGVRASAYSSYALVIVFAALLLSRRATIAIIVAAVAVGISAAIAQATGIFNPTPNTLLTIWVSNTFIFVAIGFLMITVVAQTREALAKTQEHTHLLQNISDAVISCDMNVNILTWNYGAERVYGWRADEVKGKHIGQLLQTRYLQDDTDDRALASIRDKRRWEGEVIQKTKDGRDVYIWSIVTLVKRQNRDELIAVNRDITQTKLAEAALAASEERFEALFNELSDLLLVIDGESGAILQVSPSVKRLLGYAPEDLYNHAFCKLMPATEEAPLLLDRVRAYGAVLETVTLQKADGAHCQMNMTASIVNWGERRAIFAMLRDISERLELEAQRLQIERSREEIEREREVLELKQNFIQFISHQFRTPLAVILSSTELMDKYRNQLSPERALDHLQKIRQQTLVLNSMIEDILLFGQTMAGKLDFTPMRVALDDFCGQWVDQIQATTSIHHIVYKNESGLTHALLDPKLASYIIENLLSNAVKYSPNGGEVTLTLSRDAEEIVFTVSDHGLGIPPPDIPRLFDPFHRGANTSGIRGTGLGLAIVKDSVTAHKGTIRVWNKEASGAVFEVRLPLLTIPATE